MAEGGFHARRETGERVAGIFAFMKRQLLKRERADCPQYSGREMPRIGFNVARVWSQRESPRARICTLYWVGLARELEKVGMRRVCKMA